MPKSPQRLAEEIDAYLTRVGEKAVRGMPQTTVKQRTRRLVTKLDAIKKAANMPDLRKRFKISPAMEKRLESLAEAGSLLADDIQQRPQRRKRSTNAT